MRRQSREMALGGMLSALALVILLLGGVIPLATYCCPMLAILVLLPVQEECGPRLSFTAWAAVSLLALMLVADRELCLFYVFFGLYPLLRPKLNALRSRALRLLLKIAYCSLATLLIYALLIFVLGLEAVAADFQGISALMALAMLILDNVTFLLLDVLIGQVRMLWLHRFRKRFFK